MRRSALFAILFGVGAFFFMLRSRASNVAEGDDIALPIDDTISGDGAPSDYISGGVMGDEEKNVNAMLALIRKFEVGGDRYNVLYGGRTFADFSQHPNIRVPINLPGYEGKFSTAAGAYQFLHSTDARLSERTGLYDFSPASQDAKAIALLDEVGALAPARAGDFDHALRLASSQWASLPYSAAKQHPKSIAAANAFIQEYLST